MRSVSRALPFLAFAAAALSPSDALADACDINRQPIYCQTGPVSASVDPDLWDSFGQIWGSGSRYDACGTTRDYDQLQDVWLFFCQHETRVRWMLSGMSCDMDLFVVGPGTCNAQQDCGGGSTNGGNSPEFVDFTCEEGGFYYVSVERVDDDFLPSPLPWGSDCNIWVDFEYTLQLTCFEACYDRVDNDGDLLVDCFDNDCPPCIEDCNDGIDNDFDLAVDCEDADCKTVPYCCDKDADGYWAIADDCGGDDCNDLPEYDGYLVYPGAPEFPADGADSNCDGFEDCYVDADGDFFGIPVITETTNFSCLGVGYANNPDDCDDGDKFRHPDMPEIIADGIDQNCDGLEDCYLDQDGDGHGGQVIVTTNDITCTGGGTSKLSDDCNDNDRFIYPGAPEFPADGKDSDCDGREQCFQDMDGDAYGRSTLVNSGFTSCIGAGVAANDDDCNDDPAQGGAAINPGATEIVADGKDQNCDALENCWRDGDNDTYGNSAGLTQASPVFTCIATGVSPLSNDCNDGNATVYPGAPDAPGDGIDQNCDGLFDCYRDQDGDSYGGITLVPSAVPSCFAPGLANRPGDCNDTNPSINPGATETAVDGVDVNCDGFEACYRDADNDTYGRDQLINSTSLTCTAAGVSVNKLDCNDEPPGGAAIKPGATESPNDGIDQNCDGLESCYKDNDLDNHGTSTLVNSPAVSCNALGVAPVNDDCNDNDIRIYPGATERAADGIDSDCNGFELCYTDGDLDDYGTTVTLSSTDLTCRQGTAAPNDDDCDDTRADVYPGAPNGPQGGVDYDCSGTVVCYQDLDFDGYGRNVTVTSGADPTCSTPGYSPNNADCDDNNQAIHPNTTDLVNDGIDQDCDGFEVCYQDLDIDGYGSTTRALSTSLQCNQSGVSARSDDCNDNPAANGATIYPGAIEIPADGVDQSCNGLEDCFRDADNDAYGSTQIVPQANLTCIPAMSGSGYTNNDDDCDDANFLRHPGATDIVANGVDEDCDNADACYQDLDGDTFGSTTIIPNPRGMAACSGLGTSTNGLDCYDVVPGGASIYPGATEIPGNGIDENCDLQELCYVDTDRDLWGGNLTVLSTSFGCALPGQAKQNGDCNEGNATINPGATETPADGVDQNCDLKEDCYRDNDLDQYGTSTIVQSSIFTCVGPNISNRSDDCYDIPPEGFDIHPGAVEVVGNGIDDNCDGTETCWLDQDRDGVGRNVPAFAPGGDCSVPGYSTRSDDCNDTNAQISPLLAEIPADGIDQNCDLKEDCYRDVDGDDFGTPIVVASTDLTCLVAVGVSANDDDCVDALPGGNFIYPGATEIPGDGIDQNCDGEEVCFLDADRDGYGGSGTTTTPSFTCNAPGATTRGGDCNDSAATVYPGATEIPANGIDEDCNSADACYLDIDQDKYGSTQTVPGNDLDCLDQSEAANDDDCLDVGNINGVRAFEINPGAAEVCNLADDDCDSLIDDNDPNLTGAIQWLPDLDGDTYGFGTPIARCSTPGAGYTNQSGDCNDGNAEINPGEDEVCDPANIDENCNGWADDQVNQITGRPDAVNTLPWYPDADRDTYGSAVAPALMKCDAPANHVGNNTDCNDNNASVHLGLPEVVYDLLDNDCNPATKDDDLDGDGYFVVTGPGPYDCLDVPVIGVPIHPGASEVTGIRGVDDDCDGNLDEGTTYGDDDGDGYSESGGDCNDANASQHPGATEIQNGTDDDCDGKIDEDTARSDDDGDGWTEQQGDCNDANPNMNPGRNEVMDNGIDDDCDGSVDGGSYDPDGDGYTAEAGDCDEANGSVYPGAEEAPNGRDDDCDELVDEGTNIYDDDGDGFSEQANDCNDADEAIHPGASETVEGKADGVDNDCDGKVDEDTPSSDDDGDGFTDTMGDCDDADPNTNPAADEIPGNGRNDDCDGLWDEVDDDADGDGWVAGEDCDDNDGWVNPDQTEICDGDLRIDNDCDGLIDRATSDGPRLCPCEAGDTDEECQADEGGCGCSQGTSSGSVLAALGALLVAVGRRRTRTAA